MPSIISGIAKGRKFKLPPGEVRPATSRARTALFDYLNTITSGARVLDLYCGSGGLGFEALSRGATEVLFVDLSQRVISTVKQNAESLGFATQCDYICKDVFKFLRSEHANAMQPFDIVFAAPPYRIAEPSKILIEVDNAGILSPGGLVCMEFSRHTSSPEVPDNIFNLDRRKVFGETVIEVWDYMMD